MSRTNYRVFALLPILVLISVFILTLLTPTFGDPVVKEWPPAALSSLGESDWVSAFEITQKNQSAFHVESLDEFKAITHYYDVRIHDGTEIHRFRLSDGNTIQCILIHTQGTVTSLGIKSENIQFAPQSEPIDIAPVTPQVEQINIAKLFGLDGSSDENGNLRTCPQGSFPRLMPKLENLYRFRKLENIYQKYPKEIGSSSSTPHEYAHAARSVNNIGSSAYFNIWAPYVEQPAQSPEFSLSQLWVVGGNWNESGGIQTAETGWQVFPVKYGDTQPHLFIFYTINSATQWGDFLGCYNLDCKGFVQTNPNVVIAGAFSPVSTIGGNQVEVKLGYYRDVTKTQNWWLIVGDQWVGYYPNSLYNPQGLAYQSMSIDYGGEIVNSLTGGVHTTTKMGSGRFPTEGYQYAAYIRQLKFVDTSNVSQDSTWLTRATYDTNGVDDSTHYDLILSSSTDPNWLQYFYFGGPDGPIPPKRPNLAPYQPPGWSDMIVVSNKTGCTPTACTDSSPLYTTDTFSSSWAVLNNGAAATSANFYCGLYVDGVLKQSWSIAAPFNPNSGTYVPDYPIGSLSAGSHSIRIAADSTGVIDESNEGDNEYTKTITVQQAPDGPDLTGSWAYLTQSCKSSRQGQKCSVKGSFGVSNIGNKDAPSTSVTFYLSDNGNFDQTDTLLKSFSTGKLKVGKGKNINLSYNLPTRILGSGKYVIAVIDPDNLVAETNESNNIVAFGPIP
jgi:Neprosin/CARDB